MSLATVAAVVGIGATAYQLSQQGQQGGSRSSSTYVPTGLGSADQTFQQALQQMMGGAGGAAGQINPQLMQAFQQMLGIPTSGLTQAGQQAGQYYGNLASNQDAMHNLLANQGNQAAAAGQQVWNTALDPEGKLRGSLEQQVRDQSRAAGSSRGLGMGGVGAGLENQALSNFDMNWADRQLGRQESGLQSMLRGFGQAGQDYTGASNMATAAAGNILNAGTTPFQMAQYAAGWPMQAANQYTQAQSGVNSLLSPVLQNIIPYLNQGQGATNQLFNQQQTGINALTRGIGDLSRSPYMQNVFGTSGTPQDSTQSLGTYGNIYGSVGDTPYG